MIKYSWSSFSSAQNYNILNLKYFYLQKLTYDNINNDEQNTVPSKITMKISTQYNNKILKAQMEKKPIALNGY